MRKHERGQQATSRGSLSSMASPACADTPGVASSSDHHHRLWFAGRTTTATSLFTTTYSVRTRLVHVRVLTCHLLFCGPYIYILVFPYQWWVVLLGNVVVYIFVRFVACSEYSYTRTASYSYSYSEPATCCSRKVCIIRVRTRVHTVPWYVHGHTPWCS
jgi:hypothetical protein